MRGKKGVDGGLKRKGRGRSSRLKEKWNMRKGKKGEGGVRGRKGGDGGLQRKGKERGRRLK